MISKEFIEQQVVPKVTQRGRRIDVLLIQSLFENKDKEILEELAKYQNKDGGFGNAIEPDIRMPGSSVVGTATAIKILHEVRNKDLKLPMIKQIVMYLETQYDEKRKGFPMIGKEVNDYPRAIWWNYEDLDKNFPFGNPDPEIIGFLFKYRRYLSRLNVSLLINEVIKWVLSDAFMNSGMHALFSTLYFYKRVDKDVRNLIHDRLHELATKEIEAAIDKWDEYGLEPYKVFVIEPHFISTHLAALGKNMEILREKLLKLEIEPNWQWYQFEDVFETAKQEWAGHMYFDILKAFRRQRII